MATSIDQPIITPNQSFEQTPEINEPRKSKKKLFFVIIVTLLFFIIGGGAGFYMLASKNESPKVVIQKIITRVKAPPEPTQVPVAFREMTIPYLREQTYLSKLGELSPAYDGSNYSAFTTWYTSDGLTINGLLTQPDGDAPEGGWPAIVFVHGYIPPNSYSTQGQAYSTYVDYLASRGFVVFKIDLRGHGQSEGEPSGAYYSSDYIADVLNAYSALENTSFVNPKRIGLWGHSMAGNVTMRSLATKPQIPALVIWAGAVYTYEDMLQYRITDSSFQPGPNNSQRMRKRQEMYEKYGSPSAQSKFWREVAPVTYLSDVKGAIQIHHAVDDDVVNVAYSRDLNALLDKTAIPHEFYEYPSGGHNISGASFNEAMQRTAEFYSTHLK